MQFKTKHTPLTLLLPILTHSPRGNLLIYSSSFCLVSKYFLKTVIIKLTIKIIRVISIDAEKAFDKIQHPFMIKKKKTLNKVGPEGTYLNVIKVIYDNPWGFLNGSAVKKPPAMQETQEVRVQSLSREDPLEEE